MVSSNFIILLSFALASNSLAFVSNKHITSFHPKSSLYAKKKTKSIKGFAKTSPTPSKSNETKETKETPTTPTSNFSLQSIDDTTSPALNSKLNKPIDIDPNASAEERAGQILRQRFDMKSYEETQGDIVAQQKRAEAKERADKLKKLAAIDDGSFDIFAVLPTSLVKFIDGFLKLGLTVSTVLFVAAGIGICFEAYATSTGNALPKDVDQFIVNVIEPNFTPGLLVLLGFSVSLGLFASAQLGSASSIYQEKP